MRRILSSIFALVSVLFLLLPNISHCGYAGDADQDGAVGLSDALIAIQTAAGIRTPLSQSCILVWKGDWTPERAYEPYDAVAFEGASYICTGAHVAEEQNSPPNASFWNLLAQAGADAISAWIGSADTVTTTSSVGIGTADPQAALDVDGAIRLAAQSTAPFVCQGANAGAIILNTDYALCICNGVMWALASEPERYCFYRTTDDDADGFSEAQRDCNDADAGIYPGAVEVCDGLDNNCNGQVDEELVQACLNQTGVCAGATQTCSGGVWSQCNYGGAFEAAETSCDGIDNDCDGLTDEDLLLACEKQAGVCAGAMRTCSGGVWLSCDYGGNFEADETSCDGIDNDCDGITDEGLSRQCTPPEGGCLSIQYCQSGSWTLCEALPGSEAEEVTCDGLDNDCDGLTDEAPSCQ